MVKGELRDQYTSNKVVNSQFPRVLEQAPCLAWNIILGLLSLRKKWAEVLHHKCHVFNEWGKSINRHLITTLIIREDTSGSLWFSSIIIIITTINKRGKVGLKDSAILIHKHRSVWNCAWNLEKNRWGCRKQIFPNNSACLPLVCVCVCVC